MDTRQILDDAAKRNLREYEARRRAGQFTECERCHVVFPDPHEQMKRIGQQCPHCHIPSEGALGWPTIDSIHCLVLALSRAWDNEDDRRLGIILLATAAECAYEECLFRVFFARFGRTDAARMILEECESIGRRVELFKRIANRGLKTFWVEKELTDLYDEWLALREERNRYVHGDLWGDGKSLKVTAESFAFDFLRGTAAIHNEFVAPALRAQIRASP